MPAWKEEKGVQKDLRLKMTKTNLFLRLRGRKRGQEKEMRKGKKKNHCTPYSKPWEGVNQYEQFVIISV